MVSEDSQDESMQVGKLHEQVVPWTLTKVKLVQRQCLALLAHLAADLPVQGHDLAVVT